jgi:hypothetical protein
MKLNPVPVAFLLLCAALEASNLKVPFLPVAEEVSIVFIAYTLICSQWARFSGLEPALKPGSAGGPEKNMLLASMLWGMGTTLFGLLLLAPGIWFGVRGSLAIVVAAIERRTPKECLKRSEELVKGQFRVALRYAFSGPFVLGAMYYVALLAANLASAALPEPILPVAAWLLDFALMLSISVFHLVCIALLVRLYAYLTVGSEVLVTAPLSEPVSRSTRPVLIT